MASENHDTFLTGFARDLREVAPPGGRGDYIFTDGEGRRIGFAQLVFNAPATVEISRLWADRPGLGYGSRILLDLCDLADRHQVLLILKPLPFGQKPYPMARDKLALWYGRFGFEGTRRRMARRPRAQADCMARALNQWPNRK